MTPKRRGFIGANKCLQGRPEFDTFHHNAINLTCKGLRGPFFMSWKNFTRDEFACKCGCGSNEISDSIIDVCQAIRDEVGYSLTVSSGFRCRNHPVERIKSKPGTGTHCKGVAADLAVSHRQAREVAAVAFSLDVGGVGVHQKGEGRFIHVDVDPDRRSLIWTY